MPHQAAFMVPHPPMIVPDVGKGSEEQIEETINKANIVKTKKTLMKFILFSEWIYYKKI